MYDAVEAGELMTDEVFIGLMRKSGMPEERLKLMSPDDIGMRMMQAVRG